MMLYHVIDPADGKLHDVYLEWGRYGNGSTALRLVDTMGEPLHTVTINIEQEGLEPADEEVFVKAYSEGAGWTNSLMQAGIAEYVETILVGPYESPVHRCRLLVKPTPSGGRPA